MKAMILAAGLGTRLKPFTDEHPKALFQVECTTLLENAIDHLKTAGITEVIINVHHFAGQIIDFLNHHENFGLQIAISDETGDLLETGGGVKKAAWFFNNCEAAIIRNVDILSDLDLSKFMAYHRSSGSLATLAIRNREKSRYILFDDEMQLCGWENRKTGERLMMRETNNCNPDPVAERNGHVSGSLSNKNPEQKPPDIPDSVLAPIAPYAFSGIQVLSPAVFPLITEDGKFSLIELYLRLAKDQKITGFVEEGVIWKDVGRRKA
jgi:NDP-sugar pyrophosphorylase family protein